MILPRFAFHASSAVGERTQVVNEVFQQVPEIVTTEIVGNEIVGTEIVTTEIVTTEIVITEIVTTEIVTTEIAITEIVTTESVTTEIVTAEIVTTVWLQFKIWLLFCFHSTKLRYSSRYLNYVQVPDIMC